MMLETMWKKNMNICSSCKDEQQGQTTVFGPLTPPTSPVMVEPVIMAPTTSLQAASRKNFKFTSLPTELRLMIWRETFEPRILNISSETAIPPPVRKSPSDPIFCRRGLPILVRFRAREPPPIALQICRESRALALKHYIPSFQLATSPYDGARHSSIFFCPELDTVHVSDKFDLDFYRLPHCTDETVRRIKTLAVGSPLLHVAAAPYTATSLLSFDSLETLIIIIKGEVVENGEELIRKNAEELLVRVQDDRLALQGKCKQWKLPAVKVMNRRDFENHL